MVGRYVLCFCGGVVTLLLGMAAGLAVIVFWRKKMCAPQRPPQRRLPRWEGEENAPRGAHAERRAMY